MERARRVMERCEALAGCSEEPGRLTRGYGTAALWAAQELVGGWMEAAGMSVRRDAVGNLIGRSEGARAGARAILLGGHLDTVRDAGKYDGTLGVLTGIAAVEGLSERGEWLPVAVEVIAFADEEGLRFHDTYLGSRALAGTLGEESLGLTDAAGVTLREAMRAFGGDPAAIPSARRDPAGVVGFCEVHIEQGPLLEAEGLPLGVVTSIVGQTRAAVACAGEAGHAGTVPMALRRDALCAAAELALAVEEAAGAVPGMVGTVGHFAVEPGVSNVIPAAVRLTVDVRHPADAVRRPVVAELEARARAAGERRGVTVTWATVQDNPATICDPALSDRLAAAVAAAGYPVRRLPSGAGHDAVALARAFPVAMLFARCVGGISHHPAEAVALPDVAAAIATLDRFVAALGEAEAVRQA